MSKFRVKFVSWDGEEIEQEGSITEVIDLIHNHVQGGTIEVQAFERVE